MSTFTTKLLFLMLSVVGLICTFFLSVKLVPDTTLPSLHVSIQWPNASHHAMENNVTSKLEGAFSGLKNVVNIYSNSHSEYAELKLEFMEHADMEQERFHTSNVVRQIHDELPEGVTYPKITYERPEKNDIRLLSYALNYKGSPIELGQFIESTLKPRIMAIQGVNSVTFEGVPSSSFEMVYKQQRLSQFGITMDQLNGMLSKAISSETLGSINFESFKSTNPMLVVKAPVTSMEKLQEHPIIQTGTKVIKLKDVSEIKKNDAAEISTFRINGENTVGFSITADKNANQIALSRNIQNIMQSLENAYDGHRFVLTHDASIFLKKELDRILQRTLYSVGFLILFTLLIYRKPGYVLKLLISLTCTLAISAILMKIFRIDVHLYSLMALVISFGFVIDNSIIAMDHYLGHRDRKIILPILAATLTTIAPLFIITGLERELKINLLDFAYTLIVVLSSSLAISFFLVPAIMEHTKDGGQSLSRKKLKVIVIFNHAYAKLILTLGRFRVLTAILLALLFGTPIFMLPDKLTEDTPITDLYNNTLGGEWYQTRGKPIVSLILGGTLRLFLEHQGNNDFIENPKRMTLSLHISTPFGSTLSYVNGICGNFERALSQNRANGIDYFQTTILNNRSAQIDVYFNSRVENSNFPFQLKGFLEKESLKMSGVEFYITGIGKPFSTSSGEAYDSSIILNGYNYDQLLAYAFQLKQLIEANNRVDEVEIKSEASWFVTSNKIYRTTTNRSTTDAMLRNLHVLYSKTELGFINADSHFVPLKSMSDSYKANTVDAVLGSPIWSSDTTLIKGQYNLGLELTTLPDKVVKKNQEYQMVLQYQFLGTHDYSKVIREGFISDFKQVLLPGFKIKDGSPSYFGGESGGPNLLKSLLISAFMIFSICTILFESYKKSILILTTIPITFIGVFASLYALKISFSQGVYGALILLVGLVVNAGIFIIHEFMVQPDQKNPIRSYVKAFNKKIVPIIITVASTIVGLLPFLLFDAPGSFWYSFATTICFGLLFSLLALAVFLPIYLPKIQKK